MEELNRRWDGWEIEDEFPGRYLVQDNNFAPHWAWGRDVKLYQNGEFLFTDNYFVASRNSQYALYDIEGKTVNSFTAKDMDNYYGGAIAFCDDSNRWGFVSKDGEIIIGPQYDCAKSFSNGLAAVFNGEEWGFIKPNGKLVIDYKYRYAFYFTDNGVCAIGMLEGSYYYISLVQ